MKTLKKWNEVIDLPMPDMGPVTEEARNETLENTHKFRGSVRLGTGNFFTDAEYKAYREKVLNTPMP